jgi:hypothetical protein
MSDHAILPPSSSARIAHCAASALLAAQYPGEDTIESRDGTAAHWAASQLCSGAPVAVGQVADNGVTLTDEMIDAADLYAHYILTKVKNAQIVIEQTIRNGALHAENWGTPDAWYYDADTRTLHVFDFKYGHKYVDVYQNWQLINYAALILKQLAIDGGTDQTVRVVMTIVQPRCYHKDGPIREWSVMASDLRPLFNILRSAFDAAMRPGATATASLECEYCPARHVCSAAQAAAYNAVQHAYESTPVQLSPAALGLELRTLQRAATMLDARVTGLEAQALATIQSGVNVPFFGIEHGVGRTVWKSPDSEVIALGVMLGVDVVKPALVTPRQAIKAGLPDDVVAAYSHTPRGKAGLAPQSDNAASRIFTGV